MPALAGQVLRVWEALSDGDWHTLEQIAATAGASESSVSTRIRDLRRREYGSHEIETRRLSSGLFEYRLAGALVGITDLGRSYLEVTRRCRAYQAAWEQLGKAYRACEAAGADPATLEAVHAASEEMWTKRQETYGKSLELGQQTTERDLAPNNRPLPEQPKPATMESDA